MAENCYSGVVYDGKNKQYCSWIEFEKVEYYPAMSAFWQEHWLGVKDGVYVVMNIDMQDRTKGPLI